MEKESKVELPEKGIDEISNTAKTFSGFVKRNPVLFTILVALVALVSVYFWKDTEGKNKRRVVEKMASEQLLQINVDMLKLMAKPLVWSIRSEMLRGNMDQVNIYTKELVQEKNFQYVHIVEPGGKILISTNKKLEGQPAAGILEASLLQTDSVQVVNKENDLLTIAAPVMGYDKKLATIIMDYTPVRFATGKDKKSDSTTIK